MASALSREGLVRLFMLTRQRQAGRRPCSASTPAACLYMYNSGYDPSSPASPSGCCRRRSCLQWAIENGKESLDFLRGNEPYKYDLGARDQEIYRLRGEALHDRSQAHRRHQRPHVAAGASGRQQGRRPQRLRPGAGARACARAAARSTSSAARPRRSRRWSPRSSPACASSTCAPGRCERCRRSSSSSHLDEFAGAIARLRHGGGRRVRPASTATTGSPARRRASQGSAGASPT